MKTEDSEGSFRWPALGAGYGLRALSALFLFTLSAGSVLADAPPGPPAGVKLYLDHPGVYAVALDRFDALSGEAALGTCAVPADRLRLTFHDRVVPHWSDDGGQGLGRRLLFLADTSMFRPTDPRDARSLAVLELKEDPDPATRAGEASSETADLASGDEAAGALPPASVRRRLHFEQNVLRAGVTSADARKVDTLWYWDTLTQQASSQLEVNLGELADRERGNDLDLEVTVRLVGWSRTGTPKGVPQHHLDVFLDGAKIGESTFDGRRAVTFDAPDVPASLLRDGPNRLRLKVLPRTAADGSEPLLDIVYVDWVEVRYRVRSPLADGDAPLEAAAATTPRWLADGDGSTKVWLVSSAGGPEPRRREGGGAGWVLPPGPERELWVVKPDQVRAPMAIEPLSSGARSIPADTEYVMIAPPPLRPGTERLAELHRRLGQKVAVVDANAVYDEFGGGERSPEAIRRFLTYQLGRSGSLRWVLLVGDADWFEPDDRTPYLKLDATDRNWIPTWTFLSTYGPAASDHFYAMDPHDEAVPRFAVGRLPVVDPGVLDEYVSKVAAWIADPAPAGRPPLLMLTDASRGSRLQQERQRGRLSKLPIDLWSPDPATADPEQAAIAAVDRHPWVVYFGGHGSRYLWELGDPEDPESTSFFNREDVAKLEPTVRQPIALSLSCATAPFDHPSADSLGEVMVLSGNRGAVVFIGASAPLFTPPRFGEALVEGLLKESTVGEALVAAKRRTGRAQVSHLYNLLGDPALPLAANRPEGGAEKQ